QWPSIAQAPVAKCVVKGQHIGHAPHDRGVSRGDRSEPKQSVNVDYVVFADVPQKPYGQRPRSRVSVAPGSEIANAMLALAYESAERNVHETIESVLIRRHEIDVDIAQAQSIERRPHCGACAAIDVRNRGNHLQYAQPAARGAGSGEGRMSLQGSQDGGQCSASS